MRTGARRDQRNEVMSPALMSKVTATWTVSCQLVVGKRPWRSANAGFLSFYKVPLRNTF